MSDSGSTGGHCDPAYPAAELQFRLLGSRVAQPAVAPDANRVLLCLQLYTMRRAVRDGEPQECQATIEPNGDHPMSIRLRSGLQRFLVLPFTAVMLGCVSTSTAPPELHPESCAVDTRFPGTWKSERRSQVGPASIQFIFGCDCTYESRVWVAFTKIREKGSYWVTDGHVHFSRATGVITTWPFRYDGDQLLLNEANDEWHAYNLTAQARCPVDSEQ